MTGTLWLESKWALADDDDVKALQTALGVPRGTRRPCATRVTSSSPTRLVARARPTVDPANDLLGVLQTRRVPRLRHGRRHRRSPTSRGAMRASSSPWGPTVRSRPTRSWCRRPPRSTAQVAARDRRRLGRGHRRSRPGRGGPAGPRQRPRPDRLHRRRPRPAAGSDHGGTRAGRPVPRPRRSSATTATARTRSPCPTRWPRERIAEPGPRRCGRHASRGPWRGLDRVGAGRAHPVRDRAWRVRLRPHTAPR